MIARSKREIRRCHAGVRTRLRQGVTLVEMLVSVTITLLVVFAIVQVFDLLGDTMAMGRATIEMAGQLRSATNRMQMDLDNLTCPVRPYIDPASGLGYFEYVEGPHNLNGIILPRSSDKDADADGDPDARQANAAWLTHYGDLDDILAFTIRSGGEPFIGRGPNGPIQSNLAEVIWWVALADTNGNSVPDPWPSAGGPALSDAFVLLRRVLLIRPDLTGQLGAPNQIPPFFEEFDVSARFEDVMATPTIVANSLGDLTARHNRFGRRQSSQLINPAEDFQHRFSRYFPANTYAGHFPFDYEYVLELSEIGGTPLAGALPRFITQPMMSQSYGDLIMLSDVLALDVRAFDAEAVSYPDPAGGSLMISPSDPAYTPVDATNAAANNTASLGAFVDLGYTLGVSLSPLASAPQPQSTGGNRLVLHYDTWSSGYENDGFDQDDDGLIDEGTNGIDETPPGIYGVDDVLERETFPPYDVALPGIEVRFRIMEFDTRQVRQASVIGDFTQ